MAFCILFDDETGAAPRMVCDRCGFLIEDIEMAGVMYGEAPEGRPVALRVLCKVNRCLSHPEEEHARPYWQEARHFLVWLLHNTGVRTVPAFAKVKREADLMASIR